MQRRRSHAAAGFTVFELLITLMIVGLLLGAGLQLSRRGFSHEGRLLSLKLQGIGRYLYNQAILQGKAQRMVITLKADDPTQATIGFESATTDFVRETPEAAAKRIADEKKQLSLNKKDGDAPDSEGSATTTFVSPTRATFEAIPRDSGMLAPLKMPAGVLLTEVRIEGTSAPLTDGPAYIHFLPQGAVDPATIILTNPAKDQFFTLRLSPLTGIIRITRERPADQ